MVNLLGIVVGGVALAVIICLPVMLGYRLWRYLGRK